MAQANELVHGLSGQTSH